MDLGTLLINQVNNASLHVQGVNGTSFTQTDNSNNHQFQLPLTSPPYADSFMVFHDNAPSGWSNGASAVIELTGSNGVIVTPNPITDVGNIGLVTVLQDTTNTFGNVSVGLNAMITPTTATKSVALGTGALQSSSSSGSNTAIGYRALSSTVSGNSCVAVGNDTLSNCTSSANNAVGSSALNSLTTGIRNNAMGQLALSSITTQNDNTAIGHISGRTQASYNQCTFIGSHADASVNNLTNSMALGYNAVVGSSNSNVIGTSGQNLGLNGVTNPTSALSFIGNYQQAPLGQSFGNLNNLKKGQFYFEFTSPGSPAPVTIATFPIPIAGSAIASNFYKVDILLSSTQVGTTNQTGYSQSAITVSYLPGTTTYSTVGSTSFGITQAASLFSAGTWVLSGNNLLLRVTCGSGQQVHAVINYEYFGAQQ